MNLLTKIFIEYYDSGKIKAFIISKEKHFHREKFKITTVIMSGRFSNVLRKV